MLVTFAVLSSRPASRFYSWSMHVELTAVLELWIALAVGVMALALGGAPAASAADCVHAHCSSTRDDHCDTGRSISHFAKPPRRHESWGSASPRRQAVALPAVGLLVMTGYIVMRRLRTPLLPDSPLHRECRRLRPTGLSTAMSRQKVLMACSVGGGVLS